MEIISLSLVVVLNIIFILFFNKLNFSKYVLDIPTTSRKIHKKPIPVLGGLIIVINLLLFYLFFKLFNENLFNLLGYNKQIIILIVTSILIFLFGLYDDKYSINPLNKLIILFLIIYIYLALDPSLRINQLRFANGFVFSLQRYDIFFTIICFLAFLNCFNMFDGINGQSLIFAIIILFCIILKNPTFYLSVYFILILFGILILNLKNKVFLGDNGSYLLSFLLSVFLIKNYKFNSNINIEEIALILMFPFLDMIRVIFYRLMIGKHPFIADRNHLHHILLDILKSVKIVLIISTILIVMPILTYILFKDLGISMIFSIILYLAILLIFKNKRKNV